MSEGAKGTAGRVLVVDDDPQIADLLALILQGGGYVVSKASSPDEALRHCAAGAPELMIIDVNLPGMSGMELMKIVRHEHPYVEAIIVSGEPQLENAVAFVRAGAFDYLSKPVSNKRLLDKAKAALLFRKERLELDLAKTAQFMVEERPLAKYVLVKTLSSSPLCDLSLLEKDFDCFLLRSYRNLAAMSPRPEELAASFLSVVQKMQLLDHPNIAKIFEHGFQDSGDRPYVVMEYTRGRSLRDALAKGLPVETRMAIARQAASALLKMHESSIMIGAFSLDHVMVKDDSPFVKLVDFGLSSLFGFESKKLKSGFSLDRSYMAPELRDGVKSKPDLKSDVFTLGAFVYGTLSGGSPLPQDGAKLKRFEMPAGFSEKAGAALRCLIGATLQKDPAARIDSDEALSSLNVLCTMPEMLDMVFDRYNTPANNALWE